MKKADELTDDGNGTVQCSLYYTTKGYFIDVADIKIDPVTTRELRCFVVPIPIYFRILGFKYDFSPPVEYGHFNLFH